MTVGQSVQLLQEVLRYLLQGHLRWRHFVSQASFVGVDTLGIALVLVVFSGMVIALQVAPEMAKQGAGSFIGSLVSIAILRELAPVMTGVAVIAMAGSAFTAELSTMNITQQVDALKSLQVNPVRYLVLPRVTAAVVMVPLMTLITSTAGILAGMVITGFMTEVSWGMYLESVWRQTKFDDIAITLLKASIFGYLIVSLATAIGLNVRGGAKEVGEATTKAVVISFFAVAAADYLLTYLFYGSG